MLVSRSPNRLHERQYFYKYVDAAAAKTILRSRKLRWSSPTLFNDPFDVPRRLTFDCSPRELQQALAEELARLIETAGPIPPGAPPKLRLLLARILESGHSPGRRAVVHDLRTEALKHIPEPMVGFSAFQAHWDQRIPTMRILCVSECADSAPMWAHYADRHRGVVLELEALDSIDSALLMARPVIYQSEPPRLPSKEEWVRSLTGQARIDLANFFTEYQLVKASQWAYEREWRIVSDARPGESGSCFDYPLDRKELNRVILGAQCSEQDELEIVSFLNSHFPGVAVRRACWDHDARRIVV
jgi:Protein of unknown function (DUF2971)